MFRAVWGKRFSYHWLKREGSVVRERWERKSPFLHPYYWPWRMGCQKSDSHSVAESVFPSRRYLRTCCILFHWGIVGIIDILDQEWEGREEDRRRGRPVHPRLVSSAPGLTSCSQRLVTLPPWSCDSQHYCQTNIIDSQHYCQTNSQSGEIHQLRDTVYAGFRRISVPSTRSSDFQLLLDSNKNHLDLKPHKQVFIIHVSVDGQLGWSQFLAIVNKAAIHLANFLQSQQWKLALEKNVGFI